MGREPVYIGTAGWSIPAPFADAFGNAPGSHLERYATILSGVEINSSFYRDHLPKTYARWADSVPEDFRFVVKLAKEVTHERRLAVDSSFLESKFSGYRALGKKLGAVLIQLPPSLEYDPRECPRFFRTLRKVYGGWAAIEPRHATWASEGAQKALLEHRISKVVADPERCPIEDLSVLVAGGFFYFRLHGSPIIYRSDYPETILDELTSTLSLAASQFPGWCIFDNTTFGFATRDAIRVTSSLGSRPDPGRPEPVRPPGSRPL